MKKLIVVAIAIMMAAIVEASSVKWTFAADKSYAGYSVYLVSALAEGGFKDTADITSNLLGSGANSGTLAGTRSASANGVVTVSDDPGSTVNFYYVLVDADKTGYWTMASSGEAYTTSSTHQDSSIPSADGTALLSGAKTAWATGGGGGGTEGAPEPTSGLLLLVGAGLLGLRRKRA